MTSRTTVRRDQCLAASLGSLRRFVAERAGVPVIDATDALRGGSAHYRESDTHLSDPGNALAGRFVGERLAQILRARPGAGYSRPPSQATGSTRIGMK